MFSGSERLKKPMKRQIEMSLKHITLNKHLLLLLWNCNGFRMGPTINQHCVRGCLKDTSEMAHTSASL